jgi:hypothetical protein
MLPDYIGTDVEDRHDATHRSLIISLFVGKSALQPYGTLPISRGLPE